MPMGGPGSYLLGKEEEKELLDVIRNGYLSRYGKLGQDGFQGKVLTFEKEMAERLNINYTFGCNSGTSALLCCLASLGIGAGDEVIVPGFTFVATYAAVIMSNAIPVLAEIDESLNMDPTRIEELITPRTKAIIPVHMHGNPADMDPIMEIAKKHNLHVIEDSCQSVGGSYKGTYLGGIGEIAAYSLNWYKTITCGDGGMVVTNSEDLYVRAYSFHDQAHRPARIDDYTNGRTLIGLDFRMNELSGAVCVAQGRKLLDLCETLRAKKKIVKDIVKEKAPQIKFRKLNDPGEVGHIMCIIFDTADQASKFTELTGYKSNADSGWHVYNNMEHVLTHQTATAARCPFDCPRFPNKYEMKKNMLPQTDDILARSFNITIKPIYTEEELVALGNKVADGINQAMQA